MKFNHPSLLLTLVVSFFTLNTNAQELATDPETFADSYSRMVVSLGSVSMDSSVKNEGISDSAFGLKLGWEIKEQDFIYGFGIHSYMYDDAHSFSQQVESTWGSRSTEESDASGLALFGELGMSVARANNLDFQVLAGIELMLVSDRSIAYCSDCYSQDIDVNSGLYVLPRVALHANESFTLGVQYQHFFGGDLQSIPSAWIQFSF